MRASQNTKGNINSNFAFTTCDQTNVRFISSISFKMCLIIEKRADVINIGKTATHV